MPDPQARGALLGQVDQQGQPDLPAPQELKAQLGSQVQPEAQVLLEGLDPLDLPVPLDQVEQMVMTGQQEEQDLLDQVGRQEAQDRVAQPDQKALLVVLHSNTITTQRQQWLTPEWEMFG
tara:strand:- start:4655 stop:5014 length:360 start_codon:yes stop_codon:yes gene_type:complete